MRHRTGIIVLVSLLGVAAVYGLAWMGSRYLLDERTRRSEALTWLGGQKQVYSDGRGVETVVARNVNRDPTVVVVLRCSTIDPNRRVLKPGRVYSSDDPVGPMRSSHRVTTHYPPDPSVSGLWIDGKEREIGDGCTAVYISDRHPATDLSIPADRQEELATDAMEMEPLAFIDKWIVPRVPDVSNPPPA